MNQYRITERDRQVLRDFIFLVAFSTCCGMYAQDYMVGLIAFTGILTVRHWIMN